MKPRSGSAPTEAELTRAAARAAEVNVGPWQAGRSDLRQFRFESDGHEMQLFGDAAAAEAFLDAVRALIEAVPRLTAAIRALRREKEELEEAREKAARLAKRSASTIDGGQGRGGHPRSAAAKAPARLALEDVPAALVAPFRPTSDMLATAKKDPLVALAVQATKALTPDASELDRARLLAMAFAASKRDMETFWVARAGRSVAATKAGKTARTERKR